MNKKYVWINDMIPTIHLQTENNTVLPESDLQEMYEEVINDSFHAFYSGINILLS